MANSLRLPNPTEQTHSRSKQLLEDLQRRFQNRELTSQDDVRGAVYEALQQYFLNAAEPIYKGVVLPERQPRKRQDWLDPIRAIANDLAVAFAEVGALTNATTASFNFQNAFLDSLQGRLKRAASTLVDLQIANDRFNEAVIVAGDDFVDDSRIDPDAALTLPRVDVQPLGGLITLRRTGNESVVSPESVDIHVESLQDYRERLYEGQFYGLAGTASPEGGQFHFVEVPSGQAVRQSIPTDLLRRFREYFSNSGQASSQTNPGQTGPNPTPSLAEALVQSRSNGSFAGFSETEWELLAGQIHNTSELNTLLAGQPAEHTKALDPSKALFDAGASPEERKVLRKAIIDGNPDSFWQVEYTREIQVTDPNSPPTRLPFGDVPQFLGLAQAGLSSGQPNSDTATTDQQNRGVDTLDLDVRITVDLGSERVANWVDLIPLLFNGIEHLEILGLRTSTDGRNYEELPQLRTGEDGSQISRNSNAVLDTDEVNAVLATSASAFTGRGLWVFAPRAMRYLQVDLRQPVPVLVPYNLIKLTLQRTVRRRHSRGTFGRRRPSTQTTETRSVLMSYPETVQIIGGSSDPATAAQSRGGNRIEAESALQNLLDGGGVNLSNLNQSIRDAVGILGGRPTRGRTVIGAESIVNQEIVTRWDRLRYAIGIRDLGVYQYNFEEASELVSIRYKSPEPIRDISLEVDELIPKEFTDGREVTAFIDYYIGLGEGQDWFPIAPVTSRVIRTLEGNALPTVIHVNSGIPPAERNPAEGNVDLDNEVDQVRLRAVLRRPTDIDNADSFTPSLKSYRLTWTVRGGFR